MMNSSLFSKYDKHLKFRCYFQIHAIQTRIIPSKIGVFFRLLTGRQIKSHTVLSLLNTGLKAALIPIARMVITLGGVSYNNLPRGSYLLFQLVTNCLKHLPLASKGVLYWTSRLLSLFDSFGEYCLQCYPSKAFRSVQVRMSISQQRRWICS